ncbi:sensor histidine kinase [Streptomyces angustmyceticus]|uniref:sensor histidine kinase n=1 Tax=Streptomyces angustmyceticus TaxID=285578 RepID=UPI0021AF9A70|nr:ATP-binding protein [Streptomyces angustmyceticus]
MLELARHDRPPFAVEPVQEPLVRALLVGKTVAAGRLGVRLSLSASSSLRDGMERPEDLVTVLGNLIDNAQDAALSQHRTARRERPFVEVRLRERVGVTEVQVSDNGPGVPSAKRQWIFTRGASTKRHAAGHRGMGLAIVADVVSQRGGGVSVTERAGGGARFTAHLLRACSRAGAGSLS